MQLFIILLLSFNHALYAKQALVVGGSCDDLASNNNFVKSHTNGAKFFQKKGYSLSTLYGNQEARKKLIAGGYPEPESKMKDFTWSNFKDSLAPSNFKDGEEVTIVVNTHGSPSPHGICTEDGKFHPVSELKPLIKKLRKEKNINGGVLFFQLKKSINSLLCFQLFPTILELIVNMKLG